MRAIEEGLPILRSTPTGISAVIAADGRLLGTVPPHQAGAIEVAMPLPLPPTLFSQAGNWMAGLVAGLLVALAGAIRTEGGGGGKGGVSTGRDGGSPGQYKNIH